MSAAIDAVEREFQVNIKPQADARLQILSGTVEPSDADVKAGLPEDRKDEIELTGSATATKGIPNFWLEALQHHVIIREFITERDEEALAFVTDVTCDVLEAPAEGFGITFHFAENPFFTNTTLTKTFTLARQQDDAVLSKAEGVVINWKEGKNLGMKTVTKKVKSKAKKGQTKFVTSEEPCETFFQFFTTEEDNEGEEEWMAMAETLKDKIIPFAVEYFTGEAPNGESDLEDEDYDDEEEEEEEEEEEPVPPTRGGRGGSQPAGRGGYQAPAPKRGGGGGGRGGQQDCKQQ
jgi:nucleosome assembly protein 1-like 1